MEERYRQYLESVADDFTAWEDEQREWYLESIARNLVEKTSLSFEDFELIKNPEFKKLWQVIKPYVLKRTSPGKNIVTILKERLRSDSTSF